MPEPLAESQPPAHGDQTPEARTFEKPNLVLRDPDPYAFANRIRRLTLAFSLLAVVAAGPYLFQQYRYYWRYAAVKAEYDAANESLHKVRYRLQDFTLASRMVAKKVGPSVVNIYRPGFRGTDGQGSGVVMDKQGYILTNHHVVEGAAGLRVQLDDGRDVAATVVGFDRATDMAVLRVHATGLLPAEWGDSESLELGDMVWALGSPFGLNRSVTFGIVSAKHRGRSNGITDSVYQEYMQHDAAVNPGNSGGPLVDLEGKVVGINTAILGPTYQGVSFAIPSNEAREKYEQLRDRGYIERGYLGVEPRDVPEPLRQKLDLPKGEGVLVYNVVSNGPASQAGMRRGDVILKWNDHQAGDPTALSRTIARTEIGSKAAVVVRRMGRDAPFEKELNIEVGLKPWSDLPSGGR